MYKIKIKIKIKKEPITSNKRMKKIKKKKIVRKY